MINALEYSSHYILPPQVAKENTEIISEMTSLLTKYSEAVSFVYILLTNLFDVNMSKFPESRIIVNAGTNRDCVDVKSHYCTNFATVRANRLWH